MSAKAKKKEARGYVIQSPNGSTLVVSNLGARMVQLNVPNNKGKLQNIILGFEDLNLYEKEAVQYFGAFIAPMANRIKDSSFSLKDKKYSFPSNEGKHLLHSGDFSLHKKEWRVKTRTDQEIVLICTHKDKTGGYPGNIHFEVRYAFDKKNALELSFQCTSDCDTHVNATFHPYFNLGDFNKDIEDHFLKINADEFIPVDSKLIPTGEQRNAKNTIFDFTTEKKIRNNLYILDSQLDSGGGFDHCFVLNKDKEPAAELWSESSGIRMKMYTTEPGLQFYSGNYNSFEIKGKQFVKRGGLCLEPQHFPNSPNENSFPSTLLKKNESYHSKTTLEFTIDK